ncbi:MAG TPA: polysaccharide pyruvyl transferase YvfF [Epulopiscium sp.]|nr:polysaccharide pyruvyl transferase YvfF [Candidatus Epulonipiscium sp.]
MKIQSIHDFYSLFEERLKREINYNYCLLDIPNHRNIGDLLIWQGELDFLKKNVNFPCIYTSNLHLFDNKRVGDSIILLHGGGNMGDLWEHHNNYRLEVIKKFPDNKIIILPQSMEFHFEDKLNRTVEIYEGHPNLMVCARDKHTYNILTALCKKTKVILLPDMAFCSSYSSFNKGSGKLYLKRKDKELNTKIDSSLFADFDTLDWPTYEYGKVKSFFFHKFQGANKRMSKFLFNYGCLKNHATGLLNVINREKLIQVGIEFLSTYNLIVTTRLHGFILAAILGIPVVIVDNSYGKNKRFYDTWMKDVPHTYFADNWDEVERIIEKYRCNQEIKAC